MTASSFSIGMKHVRFAKTEDNEVHYLGVDEEGDAERSYLADEFAESKEGRRLEAEDCKAKGYGIFIMDSFDKPAAHVQKHINIFTQLPDPFCGRGLERQVSKKHDWERREWRSNCVNNVLAEESRLRFLGGWNEEDLLWERLASVSMQASRCAKLFARRLGKADEYVVQHGELEDLEKASHLVNRAKALQTRRGLQTMTCSASTVRCFKGGYRTSSVTGSASSPIPADVLSLSINSRCSRRRSPPARSVSDRTLDKNLPPLEFDRTSTPFDDDISKSNLRKKKKNKKAKQQAGSINSSTPKWSSFKKLGSIDQRGEDTLPHIPTKFPFLFRPEQHSCSPSTSTIPSHPRRGMLQRWSSWTNSTCKRSAGEPRSAAGCQQMSPRDIVSEAKATRQKSMSSSMSTFLPTSSFIDRGEQEDEDSPMIGATTDFDDSIIFNRRRTRHGRAGHPTLATLEEGGQSWNDSSSNHHSASARNRLSSSFFANRSGQQRKSDENNISHDLQDSQVSLKLEHLGLASDDDDSSDDDTAETRRRARRCADDLPKRPPTILWRKDDNLSLGGPPLSVHTKGSQLLKAERWASSRFAESTPALGAVDELKEQTDEEQSLASLPLFTSRTTRGRCFQGISQWKSVSALNHSTAPGHEAINASVSATTKSPRSKGNLGKVLKRLGSASKSDVGKEIPGRQDDKPHKQGRRSKLTRWRSSSLLAGRKQDAPVVQSNRHSDVSVVETPSLEFDLGEMGLLQQPSRRGGLLITLHSSSPALLLDRRLPDKTFSNSTLDSNSTTVSTRSTGVGPRDDKLKQNLVCRLLSRRNLLQGHASKLYPDSGGRSQNN
jgi:hypothetical protein